MNFCMYDNDRSEWMHKFLDQKGISAGGFVPSASQKDVSHVIVLAFLVKPWSIGDGELVYIDSGDNRKDLNVFYVYFLRYICKIIYSEQCGPVVLNNVKCF